MNYEDPRAAADAPAPCEDAFHTPNRPEDGTGTSVLPTAVTTRPNTDRVSIMQSLPTLADKMTLLRVKTKRIRRTVKDKAAAAQIAASTGTDERLWNVSQKLFKGSRRFARAQTALSEVEKFKNKWTSPWLDDGFRCFANDQYFFLSQGINPLVQEARDANQDFRDNYHAEVNADIAYRRGNASWDDYPPDAPDLEITVRFQPVPSSDDFRVTPSDADVAALNDAMDEAAKLQRADIFKRTLTPLLELSERLGEYTGDKGQRWSMSRVNGVLDQINALKTLNVDNDPEIDTLLSDAASALRPCTRESIKESQVARDDAQQKIDDILSKFS